MHTLTLIALLAFWLICAGACCWLGGSHNDRLKSRRRFARCDVRRALVVAPVRDVLLSHALKFCPNEPRNATQSFFGALRA